MLKVKVDPVLCIFFENIDLWRIFTTFDAFFYKKIKR